MALGNLLAARRAPDPAELVAGKARHEDDVQRPVGGERTVEHLIGDAPAAAELHRPRVDLVHLRRRDRAVGLLDQLAANATPAEIAGEGEPDRPAADDQNGDVTTFHAASVPIPKFVPFLGGLLYELRNRRTLATYRF